jgi:hypothetical protein
VTASVECVEKAVSACDHLFAIGLDDHAYCRKCYLCVDTERLLAGYCRADAAEARVKELEGALLHALDVTTSYLKGSSDRAFLREQHEDCRRVLDASTLGDAQ